MSDKIKNVIVILLAGTIVFGLFSVVSAYLINDSYNPFLYFRF